MRDAIIENNRTLRRRNDGHLENSKLRATQSDLFYLHKRPFSAEYYDPEEERHTTHTRRTMH